MSILTNESGCVETRGKAVSCSSGKFKLPMLNFEWWSGHLNEMVYGTVGWHYT
jgi:hypothetical protein